MRELSLNQQYLHNRYHIIVITSSLSVAAIGVVAYHSHSLAQVAMIISWLLIANFLVIKLVFKPIIEDLQSIKTFTATIDTLETQVYTDRLTNIPNRQHFETFGPESLDICKTNELPFGLIILDIDHFKSVNDTYGHLTGDEVLKIFSKRLASVVVSTDYLARIGGEEFVVMLPGYNLEQTLTIARNMHHAIRCNPFSTPTPLGQNLSLNITVSVGINMAKPSYTGTLEQLLDHADKALYHVKNNRRDNIGLYKGVSIVEMMYPP